MASLKDDEISAILSRVDDEEEVDPPNDLDSEVEDILEIDSEQPTDSSSDSDDEPLRAPNMCRRRRIHSSDSSDNERLSEHIRSGEQQQAAQVISPSTNKRTQSRNIVHIIQGPKNEAKNAMTPLEQFKLFISDSMVSIIVLHTNMEISTKREKYAAKTATVSETCADEIYALIGLLLLSARKKDNHLTTAELFDSSESGTKYISVMSKDRFDFLLNCLRFDDKSTRQERQVTDKFAPIREIWEKLIAVCRDSYEPGSYVTVDEQLLGFRGRCPFRMYIPSKPDKYGIKTVVLCDSKSNYMIDAIPYMGKGTNTNGEPLASFFVKQLTETIRGTSRNVTMDNWFTSVPLAKELLQEPHKLTIVGTIRSNKREIPSQLLQPRQTRSSMFCYDGNCTLVSFRPKKNKNVLLLSTTHGIGTLAPSGKPDIIEFYNSTKGAVDTFDQMCHNMSCNRKTQRWPLCYFYGMLNMSIVNSFIIRVHNNVKNKQKPLTRRAFIKEVFLHYLTWLVCSNNQNQIMSGVI
ncbi:unnamed protein product [Euphydryas editha]|uniref:PiggyBac transposable element-derived protein domain-containing protein n=1 Tax=Euphydryas editha TaxID=104508 RepID=A0AAU9VD28_EUPED|nr:unnamed protein product [Euphydryas editha]